jgi:hypothetical protein
LDAWSIPGHFLTSGKCDTVPLQMPSTAGLVRDTVHVSAGKGRY